MSQRTSWGRRIVQLVIFLLVGWGIFHSIRRSADELALQQRKLEQQAERLRATAQATEDAADQQALRRQAQELSSQAGKFWQPSPLGLLLAGILYAGGMLPACLFWRRCLLALGQPGQLLAVMWAYFYGNLGKYFPGKAMVIVLRLAALDSHGIQKVATSVTIFMETLTMMSVGGAVAAICLIFLDLDWRLTLLACGLLLLTFIPTSPPLLRFILPKIQPRADKDRLRLWTSRIRWPLLAEGWILLTITWGLFGLSLMCVLASLPSSTLRETGTVEFGLSSCGACALAVVLGFVSLIPGGAGVREVVLATILTPVVGPVAALCGAIWLRIVWLCSELGVVVLLAATQAGRPRKMTKATGTEGSNTPSEEG